MRAEINIEHETRTGQDDENDATFLAMVITDSRVGVLAALTKEAEEHFGHQHLRVHNLRVVSMNLGAEVLATADFRPLLQQVQA